MSPSIYKSLLFPSFILFNLLNLHVAKAQSTELWEEPQQPSDAQFNFGSWEPGPTAAPMGNLELFKRQNSLSVCGFVSGQLSDSITCSTYCGFQTAISAVGCCTSYYSIADNTLLIGCNYYTQCYDSTAVNQCEEACLADNSVLLCTSSNSPSCIQYTFTDIGYSGFGCSTIDTTISVGLNAALPSNSPTSPDFFPTETGSPTETSSSSIIFTSSVTITESRVPPSPTITSGPVTAPQPTIAIHSSVGRVSIDAFVAGVIGAAVLLLILVGI